MPGEPRRRLSSWKEIAHYVDRDVRSVMRWEKDRGLPVYRVPGGKTGGVWADADELDEWMASRRGDEPPTVAVAPSAPSMPPAAVQTDAGPAAPVTSRARLRWPLIGAAAAVALTTVAGILLGGRVDAVQKIVLERGTVTALGASGHVMWTYTLKRTATAAPAPGDLWYQIADLDEDGRLEIVAAIAYRRANDLGMDTLYCFTESGELRWEYTPDDRVHFGSGEYAGPWAAWNVFVVRTPAGFRIAWPVHHHTWWPSMLLLFDANGQRETAFVHAGWIVNVASSPDGGRLFVTGSSNAREAYFLAVLDPARSGAVLPEPAGSPFACLDCGDARPLQYYAFPRTEASRAAKFPGMRPGILSAGGRTLQINVHEGSELPSDPATLYEFTATGDGLIRANYIDSYWAWHRQYEHLGHLAHSAQDCPERSTLIVSTWSADSWKTLRMPAGIATTTLPSLNR